VLLPTAKTAVPLDLPLLPTSTPPTLIEVNEFLAPVTEPAPKATSDKFFAFAPLPIATESPDVAFAVEPKAIESVPAAEAF